jgi:hypothetical protein
MSARFRHRSRASFRRPQCGSLGDVSNTRLTYRFSAHMHTRSWFLTIVLLAWLLGKAMADNKFIGAGGTLAIFIPTNSGLMIAADMRQSPRGVFCDGINKILLPSAMKQTAVVITGYITLSDVPDNLPPSELCKHLGEHPAPIDFGRTTLAFLNEEKKTLKEFNGQKFTDTIFQSVQPYLAAGKLHALYGTELAQIIIGDFDADSKTSTLLVLAVQLDSSGHFILQPVRITQATTLAGTTFEPTSQSVILPFGEVQYFNQHVLAGPGQAMLGNDYALVRRANRVSEVTSDLAYSAAVNLIDATAKTTEIIPAPSGIGGGIRAVLVGRETTVFK